MGKFLMRINNNKLSLILAVLCVVAVIMVVMVVVNAVFPKSNQLSEETSLMPEEKYISYDEIDNIMYDSRTRSEEFSNIMEYLDDKINESKNDDNDTQASLLRLKGKYLTLYGRSSEALGILSEALSMDGVSSDTKRIICSEIVVSLEEVEDQVEYEKYDQLHSSNCAVGEGGQVEK